MYTYTKAAYGGAHTQWLQTLFAYTTGPTAVNYLPALAFIPTTSPLLYSLVSAPKSHHQSYNSASQLPHLQYAKCNIFSSQLISPTLTHVYMISTSSPTGRPLRRFSCTSSIFSFLHLRTGAKIYHNLSLAQLFPFTVKTHTHTLNNALVMQTWAQCNIAQLLSFIIMYFHPKIILYRATMKQPSIITYDYVQHLYKGDNSRASMKRSVCISIVDYYYFNRLIHPSSL